jgi:hypothetical protein
LPHEGVLIFLAVCGRLGEQRGGAPRLTEVDPRGELPEKRFRFRVSFVIADFECGVEEGMQPIVHKILLLVEHKLLIVPPEVIEEIGKLAVGFDEGLVAFEFPEVERLETILLQFECFFLYPLQQEPALVFGADQDRAAFVLTRHQGVGDADPF